MSTGAKNGLTGAFITSPGSWVMRVLKVELIAADG